MGIHESAEDYLEMILVLKKRLGKVRSIDIVNEMAYSKASVSIAMKKLRENDYIVIDEAGYIELKPPGLNIANDVYDRHQTITSFLVKLGVTETVAAEDACKIEHDISKETFTQIKKYMKK